MLHGLIHRTGGFALAVKQISPATEIEGTDGISKGGELLKRQRHAVQQLLNDLLEESVVLKHSANGSPALPGHMWHISISHSCNVVAVMLDREKRTGIDVQMIKEKIIPLAEKFLSPVEMSGLPHDCRKEFLHVCWGAKEALYKCYGKGGVDFRKELVVFPFIYAGKGVICAGIRRKDVCQDYYLWYEKTGDYMLVYIMND